VVHATRGARTAGPRHHHARRSDVRIPRRRQWWKAVPGLRTACARAIEAFFAARPALTEKARALTSQRGEIAPWESLKLPHEVDGSEGTLESVAGTGEMPHRQRVA